MSQLHLIKPQTSSERVLGALKNAGKYGLYGHEIIRVGGTEGLRRVRELRSQGYNIGIERITKGTFRYYYVPEQESKDE